MKDTLNQQHERYTDRITVLDNGITVATRALDPTIFQPNRTLFSVVVRAGALHDTPEPCGIAHAVEHCIFSESMESKWLQFLRSSGYKGQGPNAATSPTATIYSMRGTGGTVVAREDFFSAFSMQLHDITSPDFSTSNVEHEFKRILHELSGRQDNIGFQQFHQYHQSIFPGFLPKTVGGTAEDIGRMSKSDLERFYGDNYVGQKIVVPVCFPESGGISHEQIVDVVSGILGNLPSGTAPKAIPDPIFHPVEVRLPAVQKTTDRDVDIHITVAGHKLYSREYYAHDVFINLFGDGLNEAIKRSGLAYFSNLNQQIEEPDRLTSFNFSTDRENARPLLGLISSHLHRLASGDISHELEDYRKTNLKSENIESASNDRAFNCLFKGIIHSGEPKAYDHYTEEIQDISEIEIQDHVHRLIHGPVALRVDGDMNGRNVPSLENILKELRDGVPPLRPMSSMPSHSSNTLDH